MTLTTVSWAQGGGPPGALRPHMVAVVLPPRAPAGEREQRVLERGRRCPVNSPDVT